MNRFARRAALRRRQLVVGCLFALSLSAVSGMTDAIGFLLVGNFVAFMSGNTTRLSIALADTDWRAAGTLVVILAAFVAGNALGVVVARLTGHRQLVILAIVGALSAAGAFAARFEPAVVCVVLAMGMINVALEEVAGHPLGVTYVTGALSRLGRGLGHLLTGVPRPGWWLQAIPWLGLFAGTVCGALLVPRLGHAALLVSGASSLGLGLASLAIPVRWRRAFFARPAPPRTAGRGMQPAGG